MGVLYFQHHELENATAAFEHAQHLDPTNGEINFNLGLALFQSNHSRRAIEYLTRALPGVQNAAETHFLLGVAWFEQEKWQTSIQELELSRAAGRESPEALFLLVRAYRSIQQSKKSMDAVAEFLKRYPDSPLLHEMLAEAHDGVNEPAGVEAELKAAIAGSPQAPQLHFLLGYFYWRWTRFEAAIAPLEEETRIDPTFAPAYFFLGDLHYRQGEPEAAARQFKQALAIDPQYGEALLGLGKVLVKMKRELISVPIPRIEKLPENNVRTGFVDDEKYLAILRHLPEHQKMLWRFAYRLGIRKGELLKIRLEWLIPYWNQEEPFIKIPGFDENGNRITKSGKPHTIPIHHPELRALVDMALTERNPECPWLFQYQGRRLQNVRTAFEKARKQAGLPDLLFHDTRRSAVRGMEKAGIDRARAMEITGHRTESVYKRYDIAEENAAQDTGRKLREYEMQQSRFSPEFSPDGSSPTSARFKAESDKYLH